MPLSVNVSGRVRGEMLDRVDRPALALAEQVGWHPEQLLDCCGTLRVVGVVDLDSDELALVRTCLQQYGQVNDPHAVDASVRRWEARRRRSVVVQGP